MADPTRIYATGDPWQPSAAQMNYWTHGARAALEGRPGVPVMPQAPSGVRIQIINNEAGQTFRPNDVIIYRDPIASQRANFNLLRFGPEFDATLVGASLDLTGQTQFAIAQDAIQPGQGGDAIIMGPVAVTLRRPTGTESYGYCSPKVSSRFVEADQSGLWPIMWEQSVGDPTADHWAVIMLMPVIPTSCQPIYDLRFLDNPSAGWGKVDLTYNSVTETIQIDFDFLTADVLTAINAHSEFVAASVTASAAFSTGVMNGGNVCVQLPDGATMVWSSMSLTPTSGGRTPSFVCWIAGPCS